MVYRSDGSGTTFNFTDYLGKVSPEWKARVGSGMLVRWPAGNRREGERRSRRGRAQGKNSIGYVEYAQALQSKLEYAALQNRAGRFVSSGHGGVSGRRGWRQLAKRRRFPCDAHRPARRERLPADCDGVRVHAPVGVAGRTRAALAFFQWSLEHGAAGGCAARVCAAAGQPGGRGEGLLEAYFHELERRMSLWRFVQMAANGMALGGCLSPGRK